MSKNGLILSTGGVLLTTAIGGVTTYSLVDANTVSNSLKKENLKPFSFATPISVVKLTLRQDLSPLLEKISISKDSFFEGSKEISFDVNDQKELEAAANELRPICIDALKRTADDDYKNYEENIKKWCIELTVGDALRNNGFKPISDETSKDSFKKIFTDIQLSKEIYSSRKLLKGKKYVFNNFNNPNSEVDSKYINDLKNACSEVLSRPFVLDKFPKFSSSEAKADVDFFQEASWFCVEPRTVKEYVEDTLKRKLKATDTTNCLEADYSKSTSYLQFTNKTEDFWYYVNKLIKPTNAANNCLAPETSS